MEAPSSGVKMIESFSLFSTKINAAGAETNAQAAFCFEAFCELGSHWTEINASRRKNRLPTKHRGDCSRYGKECKATHRGWNWVYHICGVCTWSRRVCISSFLSVSFPHAGVLTTPWRCLQFGHIVSVVAVYKKTPTKRIAVKLCCLQSTKRSTCLAILPFS